MKYRDIIDIQGIVAFNCLKQRENENKFDYDCLWSGIVKGLSSEGC